MRTLKLAAVLCVILCRGSWARAKMPPAKELIRIVVEDCKNVEGMDWPLMIVAAAQAHLGDHQAALRIAQSIPPGIWRNTALLECWQIRFEATGVVGELAIGANGETETEKICNVTSRFFAAKTLVKAGRIKEAKTFLPTDDGQRLSVDTLSDFYLYLAQQQADGKDAKGASVSLHRVGQLLDRYRGDRFQLAHDSAKLWLQLGNLEQALAAKKFTIGVTEESIKRHPQDGAWNFGRLGKLHALFGEKDSAMKSFRKALMFVEASDNTRVEDAHDLRMADYRVADFMIRAANIGIWQWEAGFKKEAGLSFDKVIELSIRIKDNGRHDGQLLTIARKQCDVKDFHGALKTIAEMRGNYWKALGYCAWCDKNDSRDQQRTCQSLLEKAEAFAAGEVEPVNSTSTLAKIAEVHGKSGNMAAARRCVAKALKISTAVKNKHHQEIARSQVRLGLLEDAYETITGTQPARFRVLPMAELAKQAARKQAEESKKKAPK